MSSATITKTAPTASASADRGASYVGFARAGRLTQAAAAVIGTRMPNAESGAGSLGRTADRHVTTSFVVRDVDLRHLPSVVSGRGEPMI